MVLVIYNLIQINVTFLFFFFLLFVSDCIILRSIDTYPSNVRKNSNFTIFRYSIRDFASPLILYTITLTSFVAINFSHPLIVMVPWLLYFYIIIVIQVNHIRLFKVFFLNHEIVRHIKNPS